MKHITLLLLAAASICTSAFAQPRPKNVYTSTTTLNVAALQDQAQPVVLNRTLYAGYNTICLPMSLSAEQLQAAAKDVQIERLETIRQEGSTLNMYFLDCTNEGIQAGVPYLIFSPKTQSLNARSTDAMEVNSTLQTVRMSDAVGNRISFSSSYESLTGEAKRYGIPAKQDVEVLESVLLPTDPEKTFLPTRCGITWESQSTNASALKVQHASTLGEISAILPVEGEKSGSTVYDLAGRRVNNTKQKGIYVVDGKKTAVK